MTPIRFQVNKRVAAALKRNHPWIYRNQCSSALDAVPLGSLVRLVGPDNRFLGLGLYDPLSAIAIRVFCWEDIEPSEAFFEKKLLRAHHKRKKNLDQCQTNGYRWIHGESDGFPGLAIDVYAEIGIAVFYLPSWFAYLKEPLKRAAQAIGLKKLYVRPPRNTPDLHAKATGKTASPAGLYELISQTKERVCEPILFSEYGRTYPVFPVSGLKTGFFLDLREARKRLPKWIKKGQAVLNLFANDGVFSALALQNGAGRVVSVERHEAGGDHTRTLFNLWQMPFDQSQWHQEDVWRFLKTKPCKREFDLVLIDPPSLASKKSQGPQVCQAWKELHELTLQRLKTGGRLLSISCTERMTQDMQIQWTQEAATKAKRKIQYLETLPPNFDHPEISTLPERHYFRALLWRVE